MLLLLFVVVNLNNVSADICNKFRTCGECIGNPNDCVWCSASHHISPRCGSAILRNTTWCSESPYYPPPNIFPTIISDKPLKSATKGESDAVQFKPQKISIKARPGIPIHFKMSYKPATDYPLDIYYLMDNSYTMKFHQEKLRDQARDIYSGLRIMTNNVRFGVGSFVEKCALPYANPLEDNKAYAFRNHLSLTEDIKKFIATIGDVRGVGNLDNPEADLDALMQVMVCNETIKWRSDARCIIIVSTDSTYHSAGDGKMVGAIKPNDMKCHVKDNEYETIASLLYDYPSVNQINQVAYDKQITIIFAAPRNIAHVYRALATKIRHSQYAELSRTSNITDMIANIYTSLVQNLEITHENVPSHISLLLDPPCTPEKPCSFSPGQTVHIHAALNLTRCPTETHATTMYVSPSGLSRDRLQIIVEADCQCECEKEEMGTKDSPLCHNRGVHACGICQCNEGSYGETCECEGTSTRAIDSDKCKASKMDAEECSGRGKCSCGLCQCDTNYFDRYCQFSIKDCPFYLGQPCGGHGTCMDRACNCTPGWKGDDCSCTLDTQTCVGPSGEICSGNGNCDCGKCTCNKMNSKNKPYTGKFCNYCEDCAEERCVEIGGYVDCYYHRPNITCDEEFPHTYYEVLNLNRTELIAKQYREAYRCKKILADGSSIVFKFEDKAASTLILIQKEMELPPVANIWIPVGIAIGAVLLIGLLTVIVWKCLMDVHDKREYEKFVEESKAAGFDVNVNPLYRPPAININNPAYQRRHYISPDD